METVVYNKEEVRKYIITLGTVDILIWAMISGL